MKAIVGAPETDPVAAVFGCLQGTVDADRFIREPLGDVET